MSVLSHWRARGLINLLKCVPRLTAIDRLPHVDVQIAARTFASKSKHGHERRIDQVRCTNLCYTVENCWARRDSGDILV